MKRELGIGKAELVGRLLTFFQGQPRSVQLALLDATADPVGELVRLRMAELSAAGNGIDVAGGMTHEQATRVIRALLDQVDRIHAAHAPIVDAELARQGRRRKG